MKLKPWTLPLLVLAGANAFPLLTVARDRVAGPVMQATFTERELQRDYQRDENSGVSLVWYWMDNGTFDSLSTDEMTELGFDVTGAEGSYSSDARTAWAYVRIDDARMEARIAAAAHEHDSLVAAGHPDSVGWNRRAELERSASRLVIERIGADPERLRTEGGPGGIVLPVSVTSWRVKVDSDSTPGLWQVNATPMPGVLHLPSELAPAFDALAPDRRFTTPPEDPHPLPRYEVVVIIGAAGLPRVAEIRPLQ